MYLRMKLGGLVFLLVLVSGLPARAGITFNVTFDDVTSNTGVGFDDPTDGATRRNTFSAVLGYIDSVLDHNGTLDIRVRASETDGGGFLAAAGPFFSTATGFQNGSAFTHITTGVDPFASVADMEATFDFGFGWNNGLGDPSGNFDLYSVALHEVTHGLGFLSLLAADGTSALTGADPGPYSVYDSFLQRGDGTKLFNAGAGDFTGSMSDLTSNDVFFGGPNAVAANGGNPVQVYAPSTFAPGSSLSHVSAPSLMNFSIAPGVKRRTYSAQELGILEDIGYTLAGVSAVPEPSSLVLLLGAASWACCGRRRSDVAVNLAA